MDCITVVCICTGDRYFFSEILKKGILLTTPADAETKKVQADA
jgi:hypothetical protein